MIYKLKITKKVRQRLIETELTCNEYYKWFLIQFYNLKDDEILLVLFYRIYRSSTLRTYAIQLSGDYIWYKT